MPSVYRVRFSPTAARDIEALFAYVEEQAGPDVALDYLGRLRRYINKFETFPKRGSILKLRRKNVRVVGFERRIAIVFTVGRGEVVILRVISKGQRIRL